MKRVLISLITFAFGGVILGVVVFANKFGIDHNVHWGRGRMIGASAGILIMIFALIISLYFDDIAAWIQKTLSLIKTQQPRNYLSRHRTKLIYISAGFIGIVVLIIYVWFISVGTWTSWPKTSGLSGLFQSTRKCFRSWRTLYSNETNFGPSITFKSLRSHRAQAYSSSKYVK